MIGGKVTARPRKGPRKSATCKFENISVILQKIPSKKIR